MTVILSLLQLSVAELPFTHLIINFHRTIRTKLKAHLQLQVATLLKPRLKLWRQVQAPAVLGLLLLKHQLNHPYPQTTP